MTIMKMTNIFNKRGSLLMAGALAFTFASCDTDTRSEQSIKNEAESRYEDGRNVEPGINEPSVTYDQGEYQTTDEQQVADRQGQEDFSYYDYDNREQLIERVRNDLDRAQQSLEQLNQRIESESAEADTQTRQTWEEGRREIEEKRTELDQQLQEAEKTSEENWEQVRNDISETINELEQEWEELRKKDVKLEGINDQDPNVDPRTEMGTQGGTQDHTNNQGAQNQN
jgi:DNA repair exonuclease SbcCD ATPase subunit